MKIKLFIFFYLAFLVWYYSAIIQQKYNVRFAMKRMK